MEISYIHAEGYPARDMKHSPNAFIDETLPVVCIATKDPNDPSSVLKYDKILSIIQEVTARSGRVIAIATEGDQDIAQLVKHTIYIPRATRALLEAVPQLFAYHIAVWRGCDAGFPDRVARRRAGNQVLLSTGISAEGAGEPPPYEFMVAIDAENRLENPLPLIRMAARIEPEWLLDLIPDRVEERSNVIWNRTTERVEKVSAPFYDDLIIEESRGAAPEAEAADLLARKALEIE
jgi:hypothetical protein